MVELILSLPSSKLTGEDLEYANKVIKGMNLGRTSTKPLPTFDVNPFWLLGFFEGEATFGIKNLAPYFQVGQNIRNLELITIISKYLNQIKNGFNFTLSR